jgi:hypothetical protein
VPIEIKGPILSLIGHFLDESHRYTNIGLFLRLQTWSPVDKSKVKVNVSFARVSNRELFGTRQNTRFGQQRTLSRRARRISTSIRIHLSTTSKFRLWKSGNESAPNARDPPHRLSSGVSSLHFRLFGGFSSCFTLQVSVKFLSFRGLAVSFRTLIWSPYRIQRLDHLFSRLERTSQFRKDRSSSPCSQGGTVHGWSFRERLMFLRMCCPTFQSRTSFFGNRQRLRADISSNRGIRNVLERFNSKNRWAFKSETQHFNHQENHLWLTALNVESGLFPENDPNNG